MSNLSLCNYKNKPVKERLLHLFVDVRDMLGAI